VPAGCRGRPSKLYRRRICALKSPDRAPASRRSRSRGETIFGVRCGRRHRRERPQRVRSDASAGLRRNRSTSPDVRESVVLRILAMSGPKWDFDPSMSFCRAMTLRRRLDRSTMSCSSAWTMPAKPVRRQSAHIALCPIVDPKGHAICISLWAASDYHAATGKKEVSAEFERRLFCNIMGHRIRRSALASNIASGGPAK